MFVTNHLLAGVAVGAVCPDRPAAAFIVGFATHLPMDCCRHWGYPGSELDDARFLRAAVGDAYVGVGVLAGAVVAARRRGRSTLVPVVAGALGAAALDIDKPTLVLFGRNPVPAPLQRLHHEVQVGVEAPEHLWRELVWGAALASVAALLLHRRRPAARVSPSARR
jgi:MYXO-CTERM domain-containing protein